MSTKQLKVSQPIGIVSALVCLAIVTVRGGNPVALKVVLHYLSPMPAAFARKTISSASIALYALARGVSL